MDEADICRADFNDMHPVCNPWDAGDCSMKIRTLESVVDEMFRALMVPMLTFAVVILRGWYQGKKRWPARFIEGALFAITAKIQMPAAQAFYIQIINAPPQYAYDYAFLTCIMVGFVGVDTLSDAAKNYFGGK